MLIGRFQPRVVRSASVLLFGLLACSQESAPAQSCSLPVALKSAEVSASRGKCGVINNGTLSSCPISASGYYLTIVLFEERWKGGAGWSETNWMRTVTSISRNNCAWNITEDVGFHERVTGTNVTCSANFTNWVWTPEDCGYQALYNWFQASYFDGSNAPPACSDTSQVITWYYDLYGVTAFGRETQILSNEFTTLMLKEDTMADLPNFTGSPWQQNYQAWAICELLTNQFGGVSTLNLSKAKFNFQYETPDPDKEYLVERWFEVLLVLPDGSIQTNGVIRVANVVSGDGETHSEDVNLAPELSGASIVYKCGGKVIMGEPPPGCLIKSTLTRVEVSEFDRGIDSSCTSCASNSDGNLHHGGGGSTLSIDEPAGPEIQFTVGLGRTARGGLAGILTSSTRTLPSTFCSPSSLLFLGATNECTVVTNYSGTILQVGTRQGLAHITDLPGTGYTITFYTGNALVPEHDGTSLIPLDNRQVRVTWLFESTDSGAGVRICEFFSSSYGFTNHFKLTSSAPNWEVLAGNGLVKEIITTGWSTPTNRSVTRSILNPVTSAVAEVKAAIFQMSGFGERLIHKVRGTGAAQQLDTFVYDYQGRLVSGTNALGGWWTYLPYDQWGRVTTYTTAFAHDSSRTISYAYTDYTDLTSYGDIPSWWYLRPRITASDDFKTFFLAGQDYTIDVQAASASDNPFAEGNLCTTNRFYPAGHTNQFQIKSIEYPNGTMSIFAYATNNLSATNWTGRPSTYHTNIDEGTLTITTYGDVHEITRIEVYDISPAHPSGVLVSREIRSGFDDLKRSYTTTYLDGTTAAVDYACCGLSSTTDRTGAVTDYLYDSLKRRLGSRVNADNSRTSTNLLSASGRVLRSITAAGSLAVTNYEAGYNDAGELLFETNALKGVTSYSYGFDVNGRMVTIVAMPDNGQRIEARNRDGSLHLVYGTATHGQSYTYTLSNGRTTRVTPTSSNGTPQGEYTEEVYDFLGMPVETRHADYTSEFRFFNNSGQLWKEVDRDGITRLHTYNALGEREFSIHAVLESTKSISSYASLLSSLNSIRAGSDRITRSASTVGNGLVLSGNNVHRTETWAWLANNSAVSNRIAFSEATLDGRSCVAGPAGTNESWAVFGTGGYRFATNWAPDRSFAVSVYQFGRLLSVNTTNSAGTRLSGVTYAYDALGRQTSATDVRTGTITLVPNAAGLVSSVTTPIPGPGQPAQTTTTYHNKMLQATNVVLPDTTSLRTDYLPSGEVQKTWGSRVYPAEYDFDYAGRMKTLTTYRSYPNQTAVTTWDYASDNGNLVQKKYANKTTGAAGTTGPGYTISPAGRVSQRTWERGITTSYGYTPGGDLETIQYDDGLTAGATNTYNRRGQVETIEHNGGTTSFIYSDAGQVLSEAYTGGPLAGLRVTNIYDHLLRRTNMSLLNGNTLLASTAYGWDSASRLVLLKSGDLSAGYIYVANSALVAEIAFTNNGVEIMRTVKSYDMLNRLTNIVSTTNGVALSKFAYLYNTANQRTRATMVDGSYWLWGYDSLGQVTGAKRYWSDNSPVAGQQFEYAFDTIGNRITSRTGGDLYAANLRQADYGANFLNQYTNRSIPGFVNVQGSAHSNASVSVWGDNGSWSPTVRKGEFFRGELGVTNSAAAVWLGFTNIAVLNTATNDIITNILGHTFVPQTPESFTHDLDGNLTGDGKWTYTWDAENRLIAMESVATVPNAVKKKLEWGYDSMWRRTSKVVSTNLNGTYYPACTNYFVYDGWNLIAVLGPQSAVLQSFTWGLDLSGSVQGAGGVGGLLFLSEISNAQISSSHFAAFDGNGNLTALLNAATRTESARYEYTGFGEVLRASGPMAVANPFRFSTEYQDDETGLLCYAFRYYDPNMGRWNSRDPFEEAGGHSLYCFLANHPMIAIDILGLSEGCVPDFLQGKEGLIPDWLQGREGWLPNYLQDVYNRVERRFRVANPATTSQFAQAALSSTPQINLDGELLRLTQADPALRAVREKIRLRVLMVLERLRNSASRKMQCFTIKLPTEQHSVVFGGDRSPGNPLIHILTPWRPESSDTWRVGMRPMTWIFRHAPVSTDTTLLACISCCGFSAVYHTHFGVEDTLDLRPHDHQNNDFSVFVKPLDDPYDTVTVPLGTIYHDLFRRSDQIRVAAEWNEVESIFGSY